ncbi:alpha/beta hydrolase [Arthrobacter oryzae]|uniref:Alpha/beta hydrolase family protein n=1 Tax=Arthrobacter oryzae TaxID=409290 RepID=A0A495E6H1_9MICC|nr:alpha/beta hydrolase [Arthrobacter oryzae]RKR12542.1 alpha/beta hydrolase family protein [Arthrobacter oryzae]
MKEGQPLRPEKPSEAPIPKEPRPASWKSAILNWSGALAAAALIAVPLWMLLSNPAVLGGHPALPILLVAAVALGIVWALFLVRHWNLTTDPDRRTRHQRRGSIAPGEPHGGARTHNNAAARRRLSRDRVQSSGDVSTWQLVRGIAGRLTALGFVAALAWLNPFPYQPGSTAQTAGTVAPSAPSDPSGPTDPTTSGATTPPAGPATSHASGVAKTEDATSITLTPQGVPEGKATTGLVFYPGAKVDAHAYQDVLKPLAAAGHLVVILKEPLGISLLDPGQARAAMDRHPGIGSWAVGGHSLGGVSASAFAASNHDVAGLLLFASYPAGNMADDGGLSVLSISGSNDGLSTPEKIAASKPLLPPTTTYVTVVGGVHAFFGDYGEQPGDGVPGVSREEAQQQIVAESLRFMDQLRAAS